MQLALHVQLALHIHVHVQTSNEFICMRYTIGVICLYCSYQCPAMMCNSIAIKLLLGFSPPNLLLLCTRSACTLVKVESIF